LSCKTKCPEIILTESAAVYVEEREDDKISNQEQRFLRKTQLPLEAIEQIGVEK
jgi:hypothetical protein